MLPNLPGFINAVTRDPANPAATGIFPPIFDAIYTYAWFVGITLSITIYYVLMRGRAVPAPKTSAAATTAPPPRT